VCGARGSRSARQSERTRRRDDHRAERGAWQSFLAVRKEARPCLPRSPFAGRSRNAAVQFSCAVLIFAHFLDDGGLAAGSRRAVMPARRGSLHPSPARREHAVPAPITPPPNGVVVEVTDQSLFGLRVAGRRPFCAAPMPSQKRWLPMVATRRLVLHRRCKCLPAERVQLPMP
jgi:hypothetical protein